MAKDPDTRRRSELAAKIENAKRDGATAEIFETLKAEWDKLPRGRVVMVKGPAGEFLVPADTD